MKDFGLGPIADGGRAVVIGGGPGGTAAAIALKKGGLALGRDLHVTIVEGKQFSNEQQHNQCAGVLSPPIVELIEKNLGISFPNHLCRNLIRGYVLHTARRAITLEGEGPPSISLRRVHFDAHMLEAAQEHRIEVLRARVTDLEFHADRVVIYTDNRPLEADVLVGAFGLDEGTAALFIRTVGYRPPAALNSIVTKYHPGEAGIAQFGDRIHAFLPASEKIEFGAVTPKGNHLTINIAGAAVNADHMNAFLRAPEVRQILPFLENAQRFDAKDLRFYRGRFPLGLARNFSGDRYVMVGDAAGLVRTFKGKGVTSAIQTGLRAAETILEKGISAQAFQAYQDANGDITSDLPYGRVMRTLTILASKSGLMDAVLAAAGHNHDLRLALFDAVSAHRPYRDVIRSAFSPGSLSSILRAMLQVGRHMPERPQ